MDINKNANLSMLCDFYELTMGNGYFVQGMQDRITYFDIFFRSVPDNGGVYLVSAFTGLGAPRWDMYARGAIVGLTRGSNKAHIARATLEGIAYQVKDLLDAMQIDAESPISVLRVDGGASVSSFLMQFQADMINAPVKRPQCVETTAMGAAYLAGLAEQVYVIHRRKEFRGAVVTVEKLKEKENVTFVLEHQVKEITGKAKVTGVALEDGTVIDEVSYTSKWHASSIKVFIRISGSFLLAST